MGALTPRTRVLPVPRKRPRQARATITVDAIVTAVEQILEREGPDGLTTNRVAEVAGVSIGTLYHYYPNKEALIGAVQERYLEITLGLCRAALAAADAVPIAVLCERIAAALVAAFEVQRPIHGWLIELRTAAGFHDRFRAALERWVDEIAAFLAARRDVALHDPRAAAFVLVHGIEGIVAATGSRKGRIDARAIADAARAMVAAYLRAER